MFEPVNGVQAAPPTTGLVASAQTPDDGARWQQGIAWRSERCPTASGFDPCGSEFTPEVGPGGDDINYYRPVAFRVFDECSTRTRDYDQNRVRRQAVAVTSWMVARELEQGTITQLNPYDSPLTEDQDYTAVNAFLAQASGAQIVADGPFDTPLDAIGPLEDAARDAQLGMDPFIHVSLRFLPWLVDYVEREGNLLRTKTGAIVVVDAGYTGGGPLTGGTSEVQTVTVNGAPTGGNFALIFDGERTIDIGYDSPALDVQGALNSLPNLSGVTVSGPAGGPYVVTFPASMGEVPLMTADDDLTGGTDPSVTVAETTPGVDPGPTAGDWMYATGPVQVRLSDIEVLPDIVWRENRQQVIAQRLFAATFDPCTLRAAQVVSP